MSSPYNKNKDPLAAYWAKREQDLVSAIPGQSAKNLPHYEPAHVTQGKSISLPTARPDEFGEVDVAKIMQQKLVAGQVNSGGGGGQSQTANLKEGYRFYTILQAQGFGHTFTLAKVAGTIGGPTSKNVTIKGERKCLVVEGQIVDLSKIDENSSNFIFLFEVSVPWIGNFLVPKEAIVMDGRNASAFGNRHLLKG